jgi:hypothetical protein
VASAVIALRKRRARFTKAASSVTCCRTRAAPRSTILT